MTHSSPSRTARVRMPATSLPASGSVTAMAATISPRDGRAQVALLELVAAEAVQRRRRHVGLHADGHRDPAAAGAAHLLAVDDGVAVVGALAAVGRVVLEAQDAERRRASGTARGPGRCRRAPTRRRAGRSRARRRRGRSCGTGRARAVNCIRRRRQVGEGGGRASPRACRRRAGSGGRPPWPAGTRRVPWPADRGGSRRRRRDRAGP